MAYEKLNWQPGDEITAEKLNHIDDGIVGAKGLPHFPEPVYYAACGDSITHANHNGIENISTDDDFYPIDGYQGTVYARKNYAYYIAQRNNMKWANYGYGGTTLTSCHPKGYPGNATRPFVEDRITQLKEGVDWDYISIFFGYNDVTFATASQRDAWLTAQYGTELGYPISASQVGATGFATSEQKAACDAATGSVGGTSYTNNDDYFFAKMIGTRDDSVTTTYCGALNYALQYLLNKYRKAKIVVIVPYIPTYGSGNANTQKTLMRNSILAVAKKWSVNVMDFYDLPYWFNGINVERIVFANPDRADGRWVQGNGSGTFAGTVEGFNHARYTQDGTHPGTLGYKMISQPIEKALLYT